MERIIMPIHVMWDNPERTILRFEYGGKWTWDEFHQAIREGNTMTNEALYRVVSIVDMRGGPDVPPNALVHLKWVMEQLGDYPNNSGVTIFLSAETMGKSLLAMLKQVYPMLAAQMAFIHVDTLEAAREQAYRELEKLGVRRVFE